MKIKTEDLKKKVAGFVGTDIVIFNDDMMLSHTNEFVIMTELKMRLKKPIAIPFKEFSQVVKKIKSETVKINHHNGIDVICKDFEEAHINSKESFDDFEGVGDIPDEFEEFSDELKTAIKTALHTTVPNDDGSDFSCLNFSDSLLITSDELLITKIDMSEIKFPECLLRARDFKLINMFDSWAENERFVFFKSNNGIIYGLKKIESHPQHNFDGFEEYFDFDGKNVTFPDLSEAIDTANIFTDDEKEDSQKIIYVAINAGKISIKGENEKGFAIKNQDVDTDIDFSFYANPESLEGALRISKEFKISDDVTKALIKYKNVELLIGLESAKKNEEE
jgi:hypothetical protein